MNTSVTSQAPDFRASEAKQLFTWMSAGESASVVGVSGTGKSNLFNHLCDTQTQTRYLGETAANLLVVRVNFHYAPDYSDRTIYSLILEQLEMLTGSAAQWGLTPEMMGQVGVQHDRLLDAGQDVLKAQRHFKLALRPFLSPPHRRLALLLDQFDDVYRDAEPRIFMNLRGLREAYKYRLAFVTFTRDLLPNLVEMDAAREEFYELLSLNVMGLRPYSPPDALYLLQRIAGRYHLPSNDALSERLIRLCGGHAGLLRAAYLAVARHETTWPSDDEAALIALLQAPGVKLECEKLWRSLNGLERKLLTALVHNGSFDAGHEVAKRPLQLKGILSTEEPAAVFAPLFAFYAQNQEAEWERPFYFDEAARQVWVMGKPKPVLSAIEFRLLKELCSHPEEVVTKDQLVNAGWPDDQGNVSDEALHARISGLRKKIEVDSQNPRFLENIHGQGYKFHSIQ